MCIGGIAAEKVAEKLTEHHRDKPAVINTNEQYSKAFDLQATTCYLVVEIAMVAMFIEWECKRKQEQVVIRCAMH